VALAQLGGWGLGGAQPPDQDLAPPHK